MAPKILIVDDMPDAIEFLPDWLQREGYETLMATRGHQALAMAEENQPDIILLDVMMPGMDGIETCRRLRMNPITADIPVILLSARSPSDARAEGMQAGATDYITKPIHFTDLLERIQRVFVSQDSLVPDRQRLLEEMAYTALTVLPCSLVWLLIADSKARWLVSEALAIDHGAEAGRQFLEVVKGDRGDDDIRYPLIHGDNPLAAVMLNRSVLIDIPAPQFHDLTGAGVFRGVFKQFQIDYITLLPLITGGRAVGVMLLGSHDAAVAESRRAQQILNSLSTQAAMVVDNTRLLEDLARRESQMQSDQQFRRMVLDTMGEGLIVVDEEAKITYVNNRLLLMTGYTRDLLYGHEVGMLFHPDDRQQLVDSLTGERRSTLPFSQKLYTRQKTTLPVLLSRAVTPTFEGQGWNTVMVVTDLSELQRNEDALQLQTLRLQAINRASTAISSASSFGDVVNISLEAALSVVQGVSAAIMLRDKTNAKQLVRVEAMGLNADTVRKTTVSWGDGLAGWVAENAKPQLVVDTLSQEKVLNCYADLYGPDLRSILAVPLIAFDEVIGVLEVVNKQDGMLDNQDLEILASLANSVAITIENARLFDQTRRRVTELSTLLDASAAVSSTLDFGDILEQIARQLTLALQVERVVIADWNRNSNQLETLAEVVNGSWRPEEGPLRETGRLPLTCSVLESSTMMLAQDTDLGDGSNYVYEVIPAGLRTLAGFPLSIENDVVGVVTLHSESSGEAFSQIRAGVVADVVTQWQEGMRREGWLTEVNLTDLSQRVLQASGLRWCCISCWDQERDEIRLVREVGRALWLEDVRQVWDVSQYTSLARVLRIGAPVTLKRDDLVDDLHEQRYLQRVGGNTCLVTPLLIRGESSGLVKLIDSKPHPRDFDGAEISLAQGIANVVGNAMENAQLYSTQENRATALEAAYKELQEADRLKDELLQNLSHELRTPLTHILGYLRLVLDDAFGSLNQEQADAVRLVLGKAQHLADMVKDIVTVQDADVHNLDPKPIHLDRVLALAIRSKVSKARRQGIEIESRVPDDLPVAFADPVRVGEVFEELLENAIKFSPRDTVIEVALSDPGGPMLHISVRDHGIGIAPEEQDRIFRRFYQVDSGTTRRFGGTGLGLAIVRQVTEGHNGKVWVESEAGKGSCFHFTLPKAVMVPPAQKEYTS